MPDAAIPTPAPTPGTLILVVGPSGAGKDTLIDHARTAFADTPILFARRIVTRPSSEAERHDTLDPAAFEQADAHGAFAFRWQAHGLHYAIPIAIEAVLQSGGTVVCNVSRGVISHLRDRYPRVRVLYVDAPLAVRLARIAGRDRPSEQPDRGRREQAFTPAQADVVIDNGGDIALAVAAFVSAIGEAAGSSGIGLPACKQFVASFKRRLTKLCPNEASGVAPFQAMTIGSVVIAHAAATGIAADRLAGRRGSESEANDIRDRHIRRSHGIRSRPSAPKRVISCRVRGRRSQLQPVSGRLDAECAVRRRVPGGRSLPARAGTEGSRGRQQLQCLARPGLLPRFRTSLARSKRAAPSTFASLPPTPAPLPTPPAEPEVILPKPATAAASPLIESVPLPTPRPPELQARSGQGPVRGFGRQMAQRTKPAVVPAAPADNRSFFEKLFGAVAPKPAGTVLAYAAPEDGLVRDAYRTPPAAALPSDRVTAVYDIEAHTVTLPDGTRLEAHSGLGDRLDDPRYVHERMRGPTPPHVYDLQFREQLFHGVRAIRMNPVGGGGVFGRTGLLAHTYMLGPKGDSNGCVSFRDYDAFLRAFESGQVKRLAVVARSG